jgi:hypothetical protein
MGANTPQGTQKDSIARFDRVATIPPKVAAERILDGVERREPRILIGADARKIDILQRLRPATYWKALSRRYNLDRE